MIEVMLYGAAMLILGGALFWVGKRSGAAASVMGAQGQIREAAEVAFEVVSAAEQLMRTGQLGRDERFGWTYEQLRRYVPGLTEEQLEMVIESAVLWLNVGLGELREKGGD